MKKKHLFLCLILSACGADTYEECVLDNIEDAKTPYAARLVKESCREKYPLMAKVRQSDGSVIEVDSQDFFQHKTEVSIGEENNQFNNVKIQEIERSQYDGTSILEVTNYSAWNIKGISLGVLENSAHESCPVKTSQYSRFLSCTTQSSEYIEENSTNKLYCNDAINGLPYCLVTIYLE